jgi:hypothetical protein
MAILMVAGCGDGPIVSSAPSTTAPPLVSASATLESGCPASSFDPAASLGPQFQTDIFQRDESEVITSDFLAGLAQVYTGEDTIDPCRWFTERGLRTAVAADPRLREVTQGELKIAADLLLRVAFEGIYDLRSRPPVVPIDAVFDIAAGATVTDLPTRTTVTTAGDQRVALHIGFMYDGQQWRADNVGPISADYAQWASLPRALPPGSPCSSFVRDHQGAVFDDKAGEGRRTWCEADGDGRIIRQPNQLALLTRYPCNSGHAAVLTIGRPLGTPIDPLVRYEYVRDPASEFLREGWVTAPYKARVTLPDDAAYTGWTNGNIDIWVGPDELARAVYVKRGDVVERWPRAAKDWGVIDCN